MNADIKTILTQATQGTARQLAEQTIATQMRAATAQAYMQGQEAAARLIELERRLAAETEARKAAESEAMDARDAAQIEREESAALRADLRGEEA